MIYPYLSKYLSTINSYFQNVSIFWLISCVVSSSNSPISLVSSLSSIQPTPFPASIFFPASESDQWRHRFLAEHRQAACNKCNWHRSRCYLRARGPGSCRRHPDFSTADCSNGLHVHADLNIFLLESEELKGAIILTHYNWRSMTQPLQKVDNAWLRNSSQTNIWSKAVGRCWSFLGFVDLGVINWDTSMPKNRTVSWKHEHKLAHPRASNGETSDCWTGEHPDAINLWH